MCCVVYRIQWRVLSNYNYIKIMVVKIYILKNCGNLVIITQNFIKNFITVEKFCKSLLTTVVNV